MIECTMMIHADITSSALKRKIAAKFVILCDNSIVVFRRLVFCGIEGLNTASSTS